MAAPCFATAAATLETKLNYWRSEVKLLVGRIQATGKSFDLLEAKTASVQKEARAWVKKTSAYRSVVDDAKDTFEAVEDAEAIDKVIFLRDEVDELAALRKASRALYEEMLAKE